MCSSRKFMSVMSLVAVSNVLIFSTTLFAAGDMPQDLLEKVEKEGKKQRPCGYLNRGRIVRYST